MARDRDKTTPVVVRLTPDMAEDLKRLAERDERTVAQTIRLAIRQYLEADAAHVAAGIAQYA